MIEETWLLVDANNLLWRAFYTTGALDNGAAWGFLRQVRNLERRLGTSRTVFAFDYGITLREKIYPTYKGNRKIDGLTQEQFENLNNFRLQECQLKTKWLYKIGYPNVFFQDGYEADDIIASICKYSLVGRWAVIASSDKDLYQLLSDKVSIWQPHKRELYTEMDFRREWKGIHPTNWFMVKAIAGCPSDNIRGVKGVGERTAVKYLTEGKVRKELVNRIGSFDLLDNTKLTLLPYPGVKKFTIYRDETTIAKWKAFAKEMNIESLLEI